MPVVEPDDDVPQPPAPAIVQIAVPDYKGVTVDTKIERVENLLTHVEGSSWLCQYYSQVLNTDSQTAGQNQSVSGVFQQYTQISDMELKVNTPLSTQQDEQTKQMTVRGGATVYPFVTPNTGDMFLADLGNGQEGIFQVTRSERRSVFTRTVHQIEYQLVDQSSATVQTRLADLKSKTVRKLVYDRDFHNHGQNPLLFHEEHEIMVFLRRQYKEVINRYYRAFFSREFKTMLAPGQKPTVYDTFLVHALTNFFDIWDTEEAQYVREYNRDEDDALRSTQIWTVLQFRDISMIQDCFIEYGTVSANQFSIEPVLFSLYHAGFGSVIYPKDPVLTVDYIQFPNPKFVSDEPLKPAPDQMRPSIISMLPDPVLRLKDYFPDVMNGFNAADIDGNEIDYPEPPPLIHKAMADNVYVLSRAFYENDTTPGAQSQLELQVRRYLKGDQIDIAYLKQLVQDMPNWNTMDRFYFTPILLVLMKAVIRGL